MTSPPIKALDTEFLMNFFGLATCHTCQKSLLGELSGSSATLLEEDTWMFVPFFLMHLFPLPIMLGILLL